MKFFLHFYFYTKMMETKKICLHFTEQRFEVLSGCSLCSVKFDGWNLKWIDVVSIFFLFRFFLIILNHTSQIFQSSSSHFLLFTPRHAKSQLKLIQPKKIRARERAQSKAQLFSPSSGWLSWLNFKTSSKQKKYNLRKWEKMIYSVDCAGSQSQSWKR